jgi:hypothetical protein
MLVPFTVVNMFVWLAKLMISNISPTTGVKALIRSRFSVPLRVAAPVMLSWSNSVPAVVPPMSMLRICRGDAPVHVGHLARESVSPLVDCPLG